MIRITRAILYIPNLPDRQRWIIACASYATTRSYTIVAVVAEWREACELVYVHHAADVCITARWDHLPADRSPRLEAACEHPTAQPGRERRSHRLRPAAGN